MTFFFFFFLRGTQVEKLVEVKVGASPEELLAAKAAEERAQREKEELRKQVGIGQSAGRGEGSTNVK